MNVVPLDSIDTPSHRRGLAWGIATFMATAWLTFTASPALADEFTVGIVVESSGSDSDVAVFMEGFQLAVDQSPDVSHPPGEEGGDHLGSMDVVMITVGGDLQGDELRSAAIDLVETNQVPIIAVDASSDALVPLVDAAIASGTMLIVLSDTGAALSSDSPLVFAVADQGGAEQLLTDRALPFEDVFLAGYGRPPSPAATRGYIAGRLVDISVEATNRDPSDTTTLTAALANATNAQGSSSGSDAAEQPPTEPSEPVPAPVPTDDAVTTPLEAQGESTSSDSPDRTSPALIVAISIAVLVVAWIVARKVRRPGG